MKRLLAFFLTVCLTAGMGTAYAAAAPGQDEQLQAVVQRVKQRIEIGDHYTEFYGSPSEDIARKEWSLNWNGEDGEIVNVSALEDGTILWYWHYTETFSQNHSGFAPRFPKATYAQAQQEAEAFLKRALASRETFVLSESSMSMLSTDSDIVYFTGDLYYDGVRTPESISLIVDTAQMQVIRYSRDSAVRLGSIPSRTPAVSAQDARARLGTTADLPLAYVLEDGAEQAVLRYISYSTENFYVDAQTGELVNLTSMFSLRSGGAGSAESAVSDDADSGGLTEAEQQGASLL